MAGVLPIELMTFPPPVTAGMDPYILMSLAGMYRKTNEHADPIEVIFDPETAYYAIKDGRHRVVASMMAGRKTVLATIVEG